MIFPPSIAMIHVAERGRARVKLVLPLFLLRPVGLLSGLLALPFLLVAAACLWRSGTGRDILAWIAAAIVVACALRGLKVEAEDAHRQMRIALI